ncbi:peptidyl-prolyl cis-trans isomerase [Thiovibrio sp. JS02]
MKKLIISFGILVMCCSGSAFAAGKEGGLPVLNGREVIATVNEEPIYLEEFNKALASLHGHGGGDSSQKTGKIDYEAPLRRLVDIRLALLEAENIGLGELPEIQQQVAAYGKQTMRGLLLEKATRDVKPDAKEVERLYKEEARQYVLQSLKIDKEEEARKIAGEIKAGQDFSMVAAKAIAAGTAVGSMETEEHLASEMLPQIGAALAKMKKGELSPVIPIQGGFALVKLKDIRYPENPPAKKTVEEAVLKAQRLEAQAKYIEALQEKHAKVDEELFRKLDFEAKEPGFEAMLQDKGVVATIAGEAPVTVGDLGAEMKKKFFHGVDQMIGTGKINKEKDGVLDKILTERVIAKEALAQGIDRSAVFTDMVEEFRRSMLFGAFMTKVIIPNLRLEEKDIEQYYQEHLNDFSSPPMVRLKSLAFSEKGKAEEALAKLRKGTEFAWLASHAEGQVEAKSEGVLQFAGNLLMLDTLPGDLRKLLASAGKGDMKMYAGDKGYFYALLVEDVVAPVPQALDEVRGDIKEKVFKVKLQQAFEEMTAKLKEFYPVKTYVDKLMDMSAAQ